MPKIEITNKDGSATRTIPFPGQQLTVGRQSDNDIVLSDKVASRKHCVIVKQEGAFCLKDLSSHNGTWINDNRVLEANLTFGQTFRIGGTFMRLLPDEVDINSSQNNIPTAQLVEEDIIDAPPPTSLDRHRVANTLAARSMVSGPLAKQLAPLLEACAGVPKPENAPQVTRDVRLLNRKSEVMAEKDRDGQTAEAVEALRQLLFVAFRTRATDIHVEPKAGTYTMRFRIDGQMLGVGQITEKMGSAVMNVIKVLCEIDMTKKSFVQEGSFAVELPDRRVDFRINFTPTVHGQKLALRLLDKSTVPSSFEGLGMDLDVVAELTRVCQQDSGMVILAGPTGSGKTTTLYTALKSIDADTRNIVTIEDPVEYDLKGTTQISIDPKHNVTFASVLSSVLRQDPDVILVGEIRDQETAKMAMQAATTGHLVLTTIHARDTVGTIFRLLDLGVEPFLIANAVTLCISQRLIRVLCPNCKRPYKPDAKIIRQMGLENRPYGTFYEAVGCRLCMDVGFRGRMALFELFLFNPQIRDVILTEPTISELRKAAGEWMFQTLTENGYRKVIEGTTTFQEVERVSGMA